MPPTPATIPIPIPISIPISTAPTASFRSRPRSRLSLARPLSNNRLSRPPAHPIASVSVSSSFTFNPRNHLHLHLHLHLHFHQLHALRSNHSPSNLNPSLYHNHINHDPLLFPTHAPPDQPTNHLPLPPAPHIRYPPSPSSSHGPPRLSASIASLHNAALVYLHRGLAIDAHNRLNGRQPSPSDPEPFQSAVVKGFAQIVRLDTGLEHAQPRPVLAALIAIVRTRLSSPSATSLDWTAARSVILVAARRPTLTVVGDWAWDELRRRNYARLTDLWSHLLARGPHTLALDPRLFSALVVVAAIHTDGPPLAEIVDGLRDRICSAVLPDINLDGIPQPARARYYLRAVELALLWRRPPSDGPPADEDGPPPAGQDARIIHILRRAFHARRTDSIEFCLDTAARLQEAVEGCGPEPGWLAVDWREPAGLGEPQLADLVPMALTQPLLGVLLTGFAAQGMLGRVEEMVRLARRCGGMSRYLWMALLHGLTTGPRAEEVSAYVGRMAAEDGLAADVEAECLRVSAHVATDVEGATAALARLMDANRAGPLPIGPLNTVINALLRAGELARAEALLPHVMPNATTLNHFLQFHASQPRPALPAVLAHLRCFETRGVRPDVVSFTIMLNVLLKLGVGRGLVGGLLDMMEKMGVEANGVTYGSIVHHLCRSGRETDVGLALALVDAIERRGVATTEITYTALIQAFLRVHVATHTGPGESTEALATATRLVGRLGGRGQGANQVVYNALLNALLSTGHIGAGLAVFRLMRAERDKVQMDRRGAGIVDSYGIVLRRLCEAGEEEKAREVVGWLREERVGWLPGWVARMVERIER